MEIMKSTLPIQMGRTRDIVDAVLGRFDEATAGQKGLDAVVRSAVPTEPTWTWRTCTYGDNEMGYTCGLWQLFHVVAVGTVEHNRHGDERGDPLLPTRRVSEALRNYVEHFFQCEVCRLNFLEMYDNCAFDGCHRLRDEPSKEEREWKELPLWLCETHNDVNVRLLGERLELNHLPKPSEWETEQARWPSLYACPNCWREDRSWEEEQVFQHLRSMYWSGNPSYIKIASDDNDIVTAPRGKIPLRWKLSAIVVVVAVLLARLSASKKGRRYFGRRKKYKVESP
ncbi:hypothetical protein ACHAWF_011660 [Thalassiosira exigua]